jgi:K+/H+ antiporter YhaU regulatory subunit KhtT
MLTNTGFTTDEAKLILEHPIRRKISGFLILFGAFSLAVVISILSTYLSDDLKISEMFMIIGLFSIIFVLLKTKRVTNRLKKKFSAEMKHSYRIDERPIKDVLYLNEDDYFTEIPFHKESPHIGKNIADLFSGGEDVHILFIKRGEEAIRKNLDNEQIHEGDLFYVYGNKKDIKQNFHQELQYKKEHH